VPSQQEVPQALPTGGSSIQSVPLFVRASRARHGPRLGHARASASALLSLGAFYSYALALYVLVVVTRVHESLPFLQPLYLGKLSALMLLIAGMRRLNHAAFSELSRSRTVRWVAVITVLAILSVPGSFWPRESVNFFQDRWLQGLILFVGVVVGFVDSETTNRVLVSLVAASILAAAQLLLGAGLSTGGRLYIGGGGSSTYDPNESAALFVMALPYVVLVASSASKLRWFALAGVPVLLAGLLKTGSRGGVVALGALFGAAFITGDRRRRLQCVVVALIAGCVFAVMPHDQLVQRFGDLMGNGTDYNYDARDGRLQVWKRGIGLMASHPVLGVGVGVYEIANGVTADSWKNAHNAYMQVAVELGVLGLVAFIGAILSAVKDGWRAAHCPVDGRISKDDSAGTHRLAYAVLASLLTVLVSAVFLSIAYSSMMLFSMAAATGLGLRGAARSGVDLAHPHIQRGRYPGWRTAKASRI
jgi:O-antigen ligase